MLHVVWSSTGPRWQEVIRPQSKKLHVVDLSWSLQAIHSPGYAEAYESRRAPCGVVRDVLALCNDG
jgi:hypothetical protein